MRASARVNERRPEWRFDIIEWLAHRFIASVVVGRQPHAHCLLWIEQSLRSRVVP